ncbi:MAG TPA: acetate kinase [Nocardioidaceae bacterium]
MSAVVLVLNAGSSSLKYSLVDAESGQALAHGLVERIGESAGTFTHHGPGGEVKRDRTVASHEDALRGVLDLLESEGPAPADVDLVAVGHRVVHGGARFADPTLIDDDVVAQVADLVPLAPLHNPANLEGIEVGRRLFPDLPQVAVFDTAFHQTLPEHAYTYAVPFAWREEHKIRRYGFHGTSFAFVSRSAAELLGRPPEETDLVVMHLGNGASVTAVRGGASVDTSMGLTPLEGLVMGTRSGDIDPALPAHLNRTLGWSLDDIDDLLNRASGLKGLAGENDFRELMRMAGEGDPRARLAFEVYCYRARKYLGAYYAALGRLDAVVFTAGVGEHSPRARAGILRGLEGLGIVLDPSANESVGDAGTATRAGASTGWRISSSDSAVTVLVVPTNEEWEIARESLAVVREARRRGAVPTDERTGATPTA